MKVRSSVKQRWIGARDRVILPRVTPDGTIREGTLLVHNTDLRARARRTPSSGHK